MLVYHISLGLHYVLGAIGLAVGFAFLGYGDIIGAFYLAFAIFQLYILMPFIVCPHCVYSRLGGSRCIAGSNIIAKELSERGDPNRFADRAKGLLCHNTLYMAALILPIAGMGIALFIDFSYLLLGLFLSVLGLMLFRVFVVFRMIACVNCLARFKCPNAAMMDLNR